MFKTLLILSIVLPLGDAQYKVRETRAKFIRDNADACCVLGVFDIRTGNIEIDARLTDVRMSYYNENAERLIDSFGLLPWADNFNQFAWEKRYPNLSWPGHYIELATQRVGRKYDGIFIEESWPHYREATRIFLLKYIVNGGSLEDAKQIVDEMMAQAPEVVSNYSQHRAMVPLVMLYVNYTHPSTMWSGIAIRLYSKGK